MEAVLVVVCVFLTFPAAVFCAGLLVIFGQSLIELFWPRQRPLQ